MQIGVFLTFHSGMDRLNSIRISALLLLLLAGAESFCQGKLYTAKGYWEESRKPQYLDIKQKLTKGDTLTENEKNYVQDYEAYLATYYQRLSEEDKLDYVRLKETWDRGESAEAASATVVKEKEYEWRGRDRLVNGIYGLFYGATIAALTNAQGAAVPALPLITGGLWMLGPAMNPRKYEGLTQNTVRASNSGKLLGGVYGAALGLAIGGNSAGTSKWTVGLASAGSIALGEIAFQMQKKNKTFTAGQIEMIRHYGFLGPWLGVATLVSTGSDNANLAGATLVAGGVAGMIVGNRVSRKYDYTKGDVDAISTLTLISAGVGFTAVAGSLGDENVRGLILIPAITSIAGTIWGQRAVRGLHLTDKQGSTLNLSTAGAALVGAGLAALLETDEPAVALGITTGFALITHQILMRNFKMKNLDLKLRGSIRSKSNFKLAVQVTPESYFLNQKLSPKNYSPATFSALQNSLIKIKLTF